MNETIYKAQDFKITALHPRLHVSQDQSVIALCVQMFHPAPQPQVEQIIAANEQAIEQAWLRHDVTVVRRLYADDFSGTTP